MSGGNPDLEPERADTYTAGLVLRPRFEAPMLEDLQITIDWYQVDIEDSIVFFGTTDAVANCYDREFNPELRVDNFWCSSFARDPSTGEISGALDTYRNLASQSTSGIDTQLQWSFPAGPGPALRLVVHFLAGELRDSRSARRGDRGDRRHDRPIRRLVPGVEIEFPSRVHDWRPDDRRELAIHRLDD